VLSEISNVDKQMQAQKFLYILITI